MSVQLITQNQEAFLELLREEAPEGLQNNNNNNNNNNNSLLDGGVVQLTEEEMAAVDRVNPKP